MGLLPGSWGPHLVGEVQGWRQTDTTEKITCTQFTYVNDENQLANYLTVIMNKIITIHSYCSNVK